MHVTAIKKQVKDSNRVSVFVDGKYSFSLSLDELLAQKLRPGDELDQADVKKLKKLSTDGKLRRRAMEWLLNRPHSEREFKDYLYRKKAQSELASSLIKEFTKRGYLDNHNFGQWFVDLQKRRGKSNRAIRAELFKKGLGRELVDELLATETDEVSRLKSLIAKKQKLSRYHSNPQKLAQYLVRQGFSRQLVKEYLDF